MNHLLSVKETATLLNCSQSWVKQLLHKGRLKGKKTLRIGAITPTWQIHHNSIIHYQNTKRPIGRPKKKTTN